MKSPLFQNLSKALGWSLLCLWAVIITSYGLWALATSPEESLLLKLLVFGFFLGVVLLFFSVLIKRIREGRNDKYKGVYK